MPIAIAETTRGGITESVHYGVVVVVDATGEIIASAGDPETVVFFRSSAKPFQAIPVIESGAADAFGFTPASWHSAALLTKVRLSTSDRSQPCSRRSGCRLPTCNAVARSLVMKPRQRR